VFQAHRLEVKSQLPEEPQEDAGNGITKIRFRLPKGECLDRRFQATAPLKVCIFMSYVNFSSFGIVL